MRIFLPIVYLLLAREAASSPWYVSNPFGHGCRADTPTSTTNQCARDLEQKREKAGGLPAILAPRASVASELSSYCQPSTTTRVRTTTVTSVSTTGSISTATVTVTQTKRLTSTAISDVTATATATVTVTHTKKLTTTAISDVTATATATATVTVTHIRKTTTTSDVTTTVDFTTTSDSTVTVDVTTTTVSVATTTVTATPNNVAIDQSGCPAVNGDNAFGYVITCGYTAVPGASFAYGTTPGYNIVDCASQCFDNALGGDCLGVTYTPPDVAFNFFPGALQPGTCTLYEFIEATTPSSSPSEVVAIFA